jgi:hypothetical protein
MRARVLNFSRPLYLREIMVQNGDSAKAIWITEMNWNAPPPDLPDRSFGYVTPEQQARYAVLAYQRAQQEWPWIGVINFWFFKRASDAEQGQAMYYFRMVEPDFAPMPVYDAMLAYTRSDEPPVLYSGVHQEDHWGLSYEGTWETRFEPAAELGSYQYTVGSNSSLTFDFSGSDLWLRAGPGVDGVLAYSLDGAAEETIPFSAGELVQVARGLPRGRHTISVRAVSGPLAVDSLTIQGRPSSEFWLMVGGVLALAGLVVLLAANVALRRRRWYERGRARR